MTHERLEDIVKSTAYPESNSVYQAIFQVENEMQQEFNKQLCKKCKFYIDRDCSVIESWDCYNDEPTQWTPPEDFGCNKFEEKK